MTYRSNIILSYVLKSFRLIFFVFLGILCLFSLGIGIDYIYKLYPKYIYSYLSGIILFALVAYQFIKYKDNEDKYCYEKPEDGDFMGKTKVNILDGWKKNEIYIIKDKPIIRDISITIMGLLSFCLIFYYVIGILFKKPEGGYEHIIAFSLALNYIFIVFVLIFLALIVTPFLFSLPELEAYSKWLRENN